ncbi:MAG TPA: hypothetical protein VE172_21105 [Stackebrandtia sp.]|uniref:hypothetical protein n=1 Tax=Stackebrandtia sp. TaxID=2023065 RepID=UPI002D5A8C05|nr:hypothetical protein [Stackebrandtia sp.]HZE41305.1 hypothetical protein [Stackebrandtia sp.]
MRKRYAAALVAAVALAAAGGLAYADPFSHPDGPESASATSPSVVTLPGGDRVQVSGSGPLMRLRDDHAVHTTRLANGDRVAVPYSELSRVRSGKTDPRLFDVDALVRNGYTDARKVGDPAELGKRFSLNSAGPKAGTKVTLNATWADGSAPMAVDGIWVNLDTGKAEDMGGDGGTVSVNLTPGDYAFAVSIVKQRGDTVDLMTATSELTVTDQAATVTVDGKKAKPMGFAVDAKDAKPQTNDVAVLCGNRGNADVNVTVDSMAGDAKLYAIPSPETTGYQAGFSLMSQLATPSGAAKPLAYSLVSTMDHGVTADPMVTVHDDQLAKRTADYRGLGAKSTIDRGDYADLPFADASQASFASRVALPSKRTEFFTASKDVRWGHFAAIDVDNSASSDQVQRYSGAMSPGSATMSWLSAPLSVAVPTAFDWNAAMLRLPHDDAADTPELLLRPALFDSPDPDETMGSWGLKGKSTISKDGKTLATSDDGSAVWVDLPEGDHGRYTASFDGTRAATWTPLGTRSTATWAFDAADVNAVTNLNVSAVSFNASGVSGGYADATKTQKVSLDFVTAGKTTDRTCASMTFQVSYDDGKTWKKVDISRKGDHATAKLKHPKGSRFVSIKLSAADDKGQTFSGSTIRSYGLH